jgi:hypothetical protein
MSFTVNEFRDLINILEQQSSWRADLRRWVLTEELLAFPQVVQDLGAYLSNPLNSNMSTNTLLLKS